MRLALALVLVLLAAALPARAQDRVHVDVVRALVYLQEGGANLEVRPDALPEGFDPALVVDGVTVLAGLVFDGFAGDVERVAIGRSGRSVADLTGEVIEAPPEGWVFWESDSFWIADGRTVTVCDRERDATVRYVFLSDPDGGTWVLIGDGPPCEREPVEDEGEVVVDVVEEYDDAIEAEVDAVAEAIEAEIAEVAAAIEADAPPLLPFPDDALVYTDEFGGFRPSGVSGHVVYRDASLADLAARFAADAEADGWARLSATDLDDGHVSLWTRRDGEGRRVLATLVLRADAGGVEAVVTATR